MASIYRTLRSDERDENRQSIGCVKRHFDSRFAGRIASRRYLGWVPIASLAPLGKTLASKKKTKKIRIVTKNRRSSESRTIVRREFDELSFMSPVISPLRRLMRP